MKPAALARLAVAAAALGAAGCAGGPPVPDWQLAAHGALQRALQADLSGDTRTAAQEYARARGELARTGRPELVARGELMRCAARVAALDYTPCEGFEGLRADAAAPERAYADHLRGTLDAAQRTLLPPAQQPLALPSRGAEADLALLQATADPLSRLVGAALWLQSGRASPAVLALAAETASAQGWRRPLLAWLGVMRGRAEAAGDAAEAARLGRRIDLIGGAR